MDKDTIDNNPLGNDEENRSIGVGIVVRIPFLNSDESLDC